jgi:hypothetical protein
MVLFEVKTTKQQSTQRKQTCSLPKSDCSKVKNGWHQPIPQIHDQCANCRKTDYDKWQDEEASFSPSVLM